MLVDFGKVGVVIGIGLLGFILGIGLKIIGISKDSLYIALYGLLLTYAILGVETWDIGYSSNYLLPLRIFIVFGQYYWEFKDNIFCIIIIGQIGLIIKNTYFNNTVIQIIIFLFLSAKTS